MQRAINKNVVGDHKKCNECLQIKHVDKFYLQKKKYYNSKCMECVSSIEKEKNRIKNSTQRIKLIQTNEKLALENKKMCSLCKEIKDISVFTTLFKKSNSKYARCPKCRSKTSMMNAKRSTKRKRYVQNYLFTKNYNITIETYEDIDSKQSGKCELCFTHKDNTNQKKLVVDHCHQTGMFRGLLCNNCNTALGFCKDSPVILRRMIDYLGINSDIAYEKGLYNV